MYSICQKEKPTRPQNQNKTSSQPEVRARVVLESSGSGHYSPRSMKYRKFSTKWMFFNTAFPGCFGLLTFLLIIYGWWYLIGLDMDGSQNAAALIITFGTIFMIFRIFPILAIFSFFQEMVTMRIRNYRILKFLHFFTPFLASLTLALVLCSNRSLGGFWPFLLTTGFVTGAITGFINLRRYPTANMLEPDGYTTRD